MRWRLLALIVALDPACGDDIPDASAQPGPLDSAATGPGLGTTAGSTEDPGRSSSGSAWGSEGSTSDGGDPADDPPGRSRLECGDGTAPGGALQWVIEGSLLGSAGDVRPSALAIRPDGTILVGGNLQPPSPDEDLDAVLLALEPDGTLSWSDRYDGSASLEDRVLDVAASPNGAVLVLVAERVLEVWGESDVALSERPTLLRYQAGGERAWRYLADAVDHDPWAQDILYGAGVGTTESGHTVMVDWYWHEPARYTELDRWGNADESWIDEVDGTEGIVSNSPDGDVYVGMSEVGPDDETWIRRFGADGTLGWSNTFGMRRVRLIALVPDGQDGVFAATVDSSSTSDDLAYEVRRFGPDGAPLATFEVEAPFPYGWFDSAGLHCDGDLLMVGIAADDPDAIGQERVWVARYGPDGTRRWYATVSPRKAHRVRQLRVAGTPIGDVVVSGLRIGPDTSTRDAWVGRFGGGAAG